VNASTASGTTATAERDSGYVGRFAPSPSGRLHLGSLVTAAASYLEARKCGGRWLLRIEDLDTTRIQPGASDELRRTLERLGFTWDGPVLLQSERTALYQAELKRLDAAGLIYPCSCSRASLSDRAEGYPGTCRNGVQRAGPTALRFRVDDAGAERFDDGLLGPCVLELKALGDPILRRRDGLIAYQLAVVVDDEAQGVTDIVRGADLLISTAWQRALQDALGYRQPRYLHVPLVSRSDGQKLSKSAHAVPADGSGGSALLVRVLELLGQQPDASLAGESLPVVWQWAVAHWTIAPLRGLGQIKINA